MDKRIFNPVRSERRVRLITRSGHDLSHRFPFVVLAVAALPVRSCLIDGEAFVCDENGLAVFDLIRGCFDGGLVRSRIERFAQLFTSVIARAAWRS
jgi:ATP-dependent DNA ligase